MTTDLKPVTETSKLVTVARGLSVRALEAPEVRAALSAAESLAGLVVTNDAEEASVADILGIVLRGKRTLKAEADKVLEIPKAMVSAVRAIVSAPTMKLEAGEKAAKDAVGRYLAEKRKKAQAEQARLRAEAAAAEAAFKVESQTNPEAPPPMIAAPPPAFKPQARGGNTMLHETRVLKCALVEPSEADPRWLKLDESAAKNAFRDVLARKTVEEPGLIDHPVRFCGVEFWYEAGIAARSDFRR